MQKKFGALSPQCARISSIVGTWLSGSADRDGGRKDR